jgi:S1-C subfamily serine protease
VPGLDVIAVIQGSPAAAADIRKGDTLLRLGDVELRQPQVMLQAAQRYAGQRVEVVLDRGGEALTQTVQLNAPR